MLVVAGAAATITRYVALRTWVFARARAARASRRRGVLLSGSAAQVYVVRGVRARRTARIRTLLRVHDATAANVGDSRPRWHHSIAATGARSRAAGRPPSLRRRAGDRQGRRSRRSGPGGATRPRWSTLDALQGARAGAAPGEPRRSPRTWTGRGCRTRRPRAAAEAVRRAIQRRRVGEVRRGQLLRRPTGLPCPERGPRAARTPGRAGTAGLDGLIDDDVAFVAPWGFDVTQIEAPVLLVQAGEDRSVPTAHADWLLRHCPRSELWLRPRDGHVSILDACPLLMALRAAAVGRLATASIEAVTASTSARSFSAWPTALDPVPAQPRAATVDSSASQSSQVLDRLAGRRRSSAALPSGHPRGHAVVLVARVGHHARPPDPSGTLRRPSSAAVISMTLFVVCARPPLRSSVTPSSQQTRAAQPPAPGCAGRHRRSRPGSRRGRPRESPGSAREALRSRRFWGTGSSPLLGRARLGRPRRSRLGRLEAPLRPRRPAPGRAPRGPSGGRRSASAAASESEPGSTS